MGASSSRALLTRALKIPGERQKLLLILLGIVVTTLASRLRSRRKKLESPGASSKELPASQTAATAAKASGVAVVPHVPKPNRPPPKPSTVAANGSAECTPHVPRPTRPCPSPAASGSATGSQGTPGAGTAATAACTPHVPRPTRPCPRPAEAAPSAAKLPDSTPHVPRPNRPPPKPKAAMDAISEDAPHVPPPSRPPPSAGLSAPEIESPAEGSTKDVEVWICLDFEWTCDEGESRRLHSDEGEIIEFSYVVFDSKAHKSVAEGQHYCKNVRTPITQFCTDLTGITDETLQNAGSLEDALQALSSAITADGIKGRPMCAVAHGSADLELVLPKNCERLGLQVPPALRRYVDLREAAQRHIATVGSSSNRKRVSSLRQICEALQVEMLGDEHCGLDDSWMVLFATQALLKAGARLRAIDLDAELTAFVENTNGPGAQSLCLDGLPFFAVASEVRPWLQKHTGLPLREDALWLVLGLDGRPSGRAVVDLACHDEATSALKTLAGGKCLTCGTVDTWPFEPPRERLILTRPLRRQEFVLKRQTSIVPDGMGAALVPFPADADSLAVLRGRKGAGKGSGKGKRNFETASNCKGRVKMFSDDRGFGFINYPEGEIFMHRTDCVGAQPLEGDRVTFDVVQDQRSGRTRAVNVRVDALAPILPRT
eukprot:TRINITY_DN73582_c0_g1_i1.p1 TRINITY_DN73582_c0_g1~~TRINITY_DN73582_c0_g1_i1.p1  ORF type:complete len:659 (+),score=92.46 TRINITY_DN73582_c0_g1_i1:90-2066(+)